MRVTAKVDYAVRAAILLADAAMEDRGPVKGEQIANAQDIPVKYLENILSELRQAGIVRSQRGADGGYWLGKPPGDVSIADIIRAVEGPLALTECASGAGNCGIESTCLVGHGWQRISRAIRRALLEVSLEELVSREAGLLALDFLRPAHATRAPARG